MPDSIICGVDDSAGARGAARVAGDLAGLIGARLILVNTPPALPIAPPPGRLPRIPPGAERRLNDERRERAEAVVDAVARDAGLVGEAECRVSPGDPADRLLSEAEAEEAALIVVGSRGQGAIRSALLGSVSAAVVRDARCPVVVVPEGAAEPAAS